MIKPLTIKSGWLGFLILLVINPLLAAPIGLSTRDQNPMFQAYYLPSININSDPGWQIYHALYVTNDFRLAEFDNESLLIDVENQRYDLSIAYQQHPWRVLTSVPLIDNGGGHFDRSIEDWHDFFRLPQGGRLSRPHNQFDIVYTRNGKTVFNQTQHANDVGDIAVSLSYSLLHSDKDDIAASFAVELPTGSAKNITGNDAVDIALWLNQKRSLTPLADLYGIVGVSLLGKGGALTSLQNSVVWVGQLGLEYEFYHNWGAIIQFDAHSAFIKDSQLHALGNSVQVQIGLRIKQLLDNYNLDIFFSEDILIGTTPDITGGLQLYRYY